MNLEKILNASSYNFFFLSVDPFLAIKPKNLKNFYLIQSHRLKNSGQLLSAPSTIKFIRQTCHQNNRKAVIIPFKPSAKIEVLCRQHHWLLAANPAKLARNLEDKLEFARLCQKHRLPHPPFAIAVFNQKNYQTYQKKFVTLVIQTKTGWAGKSTYLSPSWSTIKNKIPSLTPVKFSPFLHPSSTLINNCCLSTLGLIQSPVADQITGLAPLTQNPLATVGRRWPSLTSSAIQNQVKKITQKFALILQKRGYNGFFGLDFILHQNQVYLQECNSRLTASFAFYHDLETRARINSLFYLHLASFLNLDQKINLKKEQSRFYSKHIRGIQLNQKKSNGKTIAQINHYQPQIPITKLICQLQKSASKK